GDSSLQPGRRCWLDCRFDYESTIGAGASKVLDQGLPGLFLSFLSTGEVDLALPTPCHQVLNGIARRFAVAKNGVHLLGDRHFYSVLTRKLLGVIVGIKLHVIHAW